MSKLIGNQKRIDLNKNGRIDAEDFKLLRSSMNGAYRNERKHVNHNENYEVRYARNKPSRTGYKGKRDFAFGGMFGGRTYSTGRAYTNDKKHVNHSEEHEVKYIKKHPNQKRHGYGGMKYNAGGSLETHGLKKGDRILKTILGGIQQVKDKDGKIVYVNLANGERDSQPPLPFDDGGEVKYFVNKDGIRVRSKVEPKKRPTEREWMSKYNESKEARAYKRGGKVSFSEKSSAIARNFVGKRVEPKYQKEYGKRYDAKEAKEVGNKIAGAQKASYDAKAEKGAVVKKKAGNPNAGKAMLLAKEIRKDGEKWTDAVKRANAMMKNK